MDPSSRNLPDGSPLPEGLVREAVLSQRAESLVLRVRDGDEPLVLRLFPAIEDLGVLAGRLSRLRHPHLALPTRWGTTETGQAWVARPFLEGRTLAEALPLEGPALARIARDVLLGLEALHERGLVHRDLKPENVLLTESGAVLIDMDLVASAREGRGAGTPGFLAPEVLAGAAAQPASDLFSLAVALVHGAGLVPDRELELRFPSAAWWDAARLEAGAVPKEVKPLVLACLHRSPAARPVDARAARDLLEDGRGLDRLPALPELVSDAETLAELARSLRSGRAAIVRTAHPEDLEAAGRGLQAACITLGLRPGVVMAQGVEDLVTPQRGHRIVLAAPGLSGDALVSDLLRRADSPTAWIVGPAHGEQLRTLAARTEQLPTSVEVGTVHPRDLAAHLDRATGGSQPRAAEALALDLCERLEGRASAIDEALARAVPAGVVTSGESGLVLVEERWPGSLMSSSLDLPEDALDRAVVEALAVAGRAVDLAALAGAVAREPAALEVSVLALQRAGWVESPTPTTIRLVPGLRAESAQAATNAAARERWAHAWLQADPQLGRAEQGELLLQEGRDLEAALQHGEGLALEGRPTAALHLARGVVERTDDPGLGERAGVLVGRLLMARGAIDEARDLLATGGLLASATSPAARLLAADLATDPSEAERLREEVLAGEDREARDRARIARAHAAYLTGDRAAVEDSLAALEQPAPDASGTAAMLRFACAVVDGDWEAARAALDAIPSDHLTTMPSLRGRVALNRAFVERREGDLVAATRHLREAEEAFALCDDRRQEALAANNLGVAQRDRGELVEARRSLHRALRLRRQLEDLHGEGSTLGSLALVELEAGHLGRARPLLHDAVRLLERGRHARELQGLAAARLLVDLYGRGAAAARGADLGRSLWQARAAHRPGVARALAELALAEGRTRAATRLLELGSSAAGDTAERFRCAARAATLQGGGTQGLLALAERLGEGRLLETRWRTEPSTAPEELLALMPQLQARGRTDLAAAIARSLVRIASASGDADSRRRASSRLEDARRQLVESLDDGLAEQHFERALAAAGWRPGDSGAAAAEQAEWILDCVRTLASSRDRHELLERILDRALLRTGARRGYVVLARGEVIETSAARGLELGDPEGGDAAVSSSVVRAALADGRPVSTANAALDERFQGERSVKELHLRSVLCVPFHDQGLVRGAIYVDHDRADARFDDEDVRALQALADPAAVALNQLEERTRIEELNRRLEERVQLQESELALSKKALAQRGKPLPLPGVVGRSPAMTELAALVERLAPTELPVVVTGPSGSGKELIARALHHRSHRAGGPLISESVAALPEALLEAELFGARRGAYTGATEDREGLFARADGGTLFLDEIAEMPLQLQAKLLRVLETGEVRRLGDDRVRTVSVRIVAATHRDLTERVRAGAFRQDLYYRLDGGELRLPPLAERLEDLEPLVEHFLELLRHETGQAKELARPVLLALQQRPWPGQVRELRNEVTRLWHMSDAAIDDPSLIRTAAMTSDGPGPSEPASFLLVDAERQAVERALNASEGRKDQAARLLGISRSGLYTKLARLGLA